MYDTPRIIKAKINNTYVKKRNAYIKNKSMYKHFFSNIEAWSILKYQINDFFKIAILKILNDSKKLTCYLC